MIALIGLPGAGKSSAARQLARLLQLPLLDTDAVIEQRLGESIRAFFEREGETAFRDLEEAVLDELTLGEDAVLATGGGIVLRPANRARLNERATVIYLRAAPEQLFRRLRRDTKRPLLQVADPLRRLKELYAERDPLYRACAHFVVETHGTTLSTLVSRVLMQLDLMPPQRPAAPARAPAFASGQASPVRAGGQPPAPTLTGMTSAVSHAQRVPIALGERSYDITIGANLLGDVPALARARADSAALIVTNVTVAPLYEPRLRQALEGRHRQIRTLALPDGEQYKTWESLNLIFDELLAHGADRKTTLYALGGGVVGDMTGFAAACYMRGVPFVQVPTTLLAQVDSSVGGKTAVNHPLGKNMIGAFYQPLAVVCDLDVLASLPARELSAGLAEVIKYGPIHDMAFFAWIEANIDALRALDAAALAHAVKRSCEIKAEVVGQDERESGLRAILNFGHTFGHAMEAGMGYGAWLHGEAVGAGMVMAAELSRELGLVDAPFVARLAALIARAGLPTRGAVIDAHDNAGRYLQLMRVDKKAEGGEMRFVVIDGPGHAAVRAAPDALVRRVIDRCCA